MRKGFTLIELLVVIAIIGILASIVLVSLNTARSKARDTRRAADLSQVQLALEMYFDSSGAYPAGAADGAFSALAALVSGNYMPALPQDPQNTGALIYRYWTNTNNSRYILRATMENDNAGVLTADLDDCTTIGSPAACVCTDAVCTGSTNCFYCAGI